MFENFLGIFGELFRRNFLEEFLLEEFFWKNFLGEIFWEDFFRGRIFLKEFFGRNNLVEINKELMFLSRFRGYFVSMSP